MMPNEKIALITGANSGLGFYSTKLFAKSGIKVVMLCRNEEKGINALRMIKKENPDASLDLMICDLSSMKSVADFLAKFKERYPKLDILVNNAAVIKMKPSITADGFETMFQTNYLSPVILMHSLLDQLKISPSGKIINIAGAYDKYRLDFDDLQSLKKYESFNSFMKTKLCLVIYSYNLSKQIDNKKVTINCTDGAAEKAFGLFIRTNLRRELPKLLNWTINILSIPPEKCAHTVLYLSTSEMLKDKTGCIFNGTKERLSIPYCISDNNIIEQLINKTKEYLRKASPILIE